MEVLGLLVAVWTSAVYDMAPKLDLHQHWLVPSPQYLLLLLLNRLLLLLQNLTPSPPPNYFAYYHNFTSSPQCSHFPPPHPP